MGRALHRCTRRERARGRAARPRARARARRGRGPGPARNPRAREHPHRGCARARRRRLPRRGVRDEGGHGHTSRWPPAARAPSGRAHGRAALGARGDRGAREPARPRARRRQCTRGLAAAVRVGPLLRGRYARGDRAPRRALARARRPIKDRPTRMTPPALVGYFEPWWVQIIKSIVIFAVGLQLVPLVLIAERKLLGRFQARYGPNRVGPYGLLQPLADILKLLTKEQFRPTTSVGLLYALAPIISILTAVAAFGLIPFGDVQDIFGTKVGLYGVDLSIGPLYLFAFGAIAFYGIMLGGWSSGSKYSFLGAMRGAAQLISYEVSQGLALVGVIITAQTLSLTGIVRAQAGMWYVVPQLAGFLIFLTASFAETNRAPFDTTEADAELVGGYNTEYGGGRFASYYFADDLNVVGVSGIVTTVFLGGWLLPFGIHPPGWVDPFVVLFKTSLITFLFTWVRATLPRLRYDQLMSFGWRVLLPLATVNALVTAIVVVATH